MNSYTYEFEKRSEYLETYEWDNVWWEQADKEIADRVLYIGDSISCHTRRVATKASDNTLLFDGFGTSKALDNRYFACSVSNFAEQQKKRRIILFNNGLHGWHLDDKTEYAEEYERMIRFLLDEFKGTPLVLLLTTYVADTERNDRVKARNHVVTELAKKYDLPIIDLYSVTKENSHLLFSDGVHFLPEGYQLLAEEIVSFLKNYCITHNK